MSAVTPVLTGFVGDVITEMLIVVGSIALIFGINWLVRWGFAKLRSVGGR